MGPPGLQGPKGEPGIQGPSGQNVERGETGTPGMMSYKNWKECAWKDMSDNKDNGLIKVSYFCAMQMFVYHRQVSNRRPPRFLLGDLTAELRREP